jgi:hypothetical protein
MLAPFATLAFLATLWLAVKFMLDVLAEDGRKIVSALAGNSMLAQPPQSVRPVSVRYQPRAGSARRPGRSAPEWRAAA